ncbi:Gfo/Idh/MocA family oxidoreductase [bacterium]|nr:Gfo/Idh/MocA family oxidoreductase [bacterium]
MRKINISIVGTGLMGLQHIKAISKSKKANLHSIVDISKNSVNLSKRHKVPLYLNVEELLCSKNLDAVIIATPNQLHETHTTSFLKKKIPVLLEKPISNNIKSAKRIINSSKKNKTPLLIGYHRRHNSIASKVKDIVSSGKLGTVVSANILCWLYKHKEYYKETWRTSKGAGPLGINLVHDIDLICYLLGPVQFVQAFTSNRNRKYKVEDTAAVSLVFKSGALCTLNISDTIVAPWSYELTAGENPAYPITNQSAYMIGGTKGSLQFPNLKNWFYKNERSWWNKILVKEDKKKDDNTLVNQIDHFTEVVLKKIKPKVNGNDGLASLKIFAAITKSAKIGKKVRV